MAMGKSGRRTGRGTGFGVLALIGLLGVALGGPAMAQSSDNGDLRPIYAMGVDIADGKVLATGSCETCHGLDGIGRDKGAPNIAGQRPSYIFAELKAYQDGARSNADMAQKVKFLSDEALVKVGILSIDPTGMRVAREISSTLIALASRVRLR